MSRFALGKKSKFISDRSGFAFPYRERVMEWNGNLVHRSEYERKHLDRDWETIICTARC